MYSAVAEVGDGSVSHSPQASTSRCSHSDLRKEVQKLRMAKLRLQQKVRRLEMNQTHVTKKKTKVEIFQTSTI